MPALSQMKGETEASRINTDGQASGSLVAVSIHATKDGSSKEQRTVSAADGKGRKVADQKCKVVNTVSRDNVALSVAVRR